MTKWKIDWGAVAVLALLGVLMMGPLLAPQDPELVDLAKRLQGPSAANLLVQYHIGLQNRTETRVDTFGGPMGPAACGIRAGAKIRAARAPLPASREPGRAITPTGTIARIARQSSQRSNCTRLSDPISQTNRTPR